MTVSQKVLTDAVVRVWSASGDSRVGVATVRIPAPNFGPQFAIRLVNRPSDFMPVTEEELNSQWLLVPRIDISWLNVGSMWVRNADHQWNLSVHPSLRCEVTEVRDSGHVRFRQRRRVDGKWDYQYGVEQCFTFITLYNRLWGQEVPKGQFPKEPLPFLVRKTSAHPKKVEAEPKSAIDRLLDDDLLSE